MYSQISTIFISQDTSPVTTAATVVGNHQHLSISYFNLSLSLLSSHNRLSPEYFDPKNVIDLKSRDRFLVGIKLVKVAGISELLVVVAGEILDDVYKGRLPSGSMATVLLGGGDMATALVGGG